jgi:DNA-binding response OmpR family regulator
MVAMKQKILIADDDSPFANGLAADLKSEGFDARAVNDGDAAIKEMKDWKPDLLLLDLVMPIKDGFATLKDRLGDKFLSSVPVIMISQSNDPKNIDLALTLGVKDYVTKGDLNKDELVGKIKLQLGTVTTSKDLDSKAAKKPESLTGYKVLWVEDDTYLSDIISRKLANEGCIFTHAKTGEEAIEFLKKDVPDIVLLDILLPGINGFEVLEAMKKEEKWKSVPVILTSNLGQKEDVLKGEKLGAEKFLVKATVTLDEIIVETRKVLTRLHKK